MFADSSNRPTEEELLTCQHVQMDELDHPYTLTDLVDPESIERLAGVISRLCKCRISICNVEAVVGSGLAEETGLYHDSLIDCDSRVVGKVSIERTKVNESALELVDLVADILATLCRQRLGIRRRVSELTAVYDLGGLFAGNEDLGSILNIAAKRICDVMNVKAASIRLLDTATGELVLSGVYNLSTDYLSKGRIMLDDNPIDKTAFCGEVVYIEDARTDERVKFREHSRREGLVSGLACPMTYRGSTVGILRIYTAAVQRFSSFEVDLLRSVASQACGAIVHSRLFNEAREAEQQARQLKYAGQVQRRMIPAEPPKHDRISFGQVYMPTLQVGGDFFDFLSLPEGNVGLAIADVVGKGVPGSLMMASVRSALRAHARSIFNIDEIISQVNQHLCRDTLMSEFATLIYGVFSPRGSRFTYSNAGHNPPLLLRGNQFTALSTGGMVIGVLPDASFDRDVLELESGDILVFYTDGVTETLDYHDDLYGIDRFKQSILRHREETANTMANQLLWDVRRFAGLSQQTDDITLVVAKVH